MPHEISVKITKFADRRHWIMYYDDPLTGKRPSRSTRETTKAAALKAAGKWEDELTSGRHKPKSNVTWADFRTLFLEARESDCTANGYDSFVTAFNAVERHIKVDRLAQLTAKRIDYLAKQLREVDKLSDETIRSYLSHLQAALNWAATPKVGMLASVPDVDMPKRTKNQKLMKGRAISGEEFERMLAKVEAGMILANTSRVNKERKRQPSEKATVNRAKRLADGAKAAAPGWLRFLRGLWWGGLRLGEAATLSWDDERFITVDLSGARPRLRIEAGQDKSQEARLLPLAPEFAEMLLAVPEDQRTGPVFPLLGLNGERVTDQVYISRVVSAIGRAANAVVDKASGKFASAHDLRRSFGERWAVRVMPAVLKELMRHASLDTTMKYYVGHGVAAMEDAAYAALARINTSVNSGLATVHQAAVETTLKPVNQAVS